MFYFVISLGHWYWFCCIVFILQSSEDILEPKLDELIPQLREIGGLLNHWLCDHLTRRLSSLSSPDDLFNFFSDLRGEVVIINSPASCPPLSSSFFLLLFLCGCYYMLLLVVVFKLKQIFIFSLMWSWSGILGGPDSSVVDDDQTILDPNSNLGMFLRRCLLAFNLLSFEVFIFCMA